MNPLLFHTIRYKQRPLRPNSPVSLRIVTEGRPTPLRVRKPKAWYRAGPAHCFSDTAGTVPCDANDPVACWKDSSGNNKHLLQSTLSSRPLLTGSDVAGWAVQFDGDDDWMSVSIDLYPITAVVRVRIDNIDTASDVIGYDASASDNFNSLTFGEYTPKRWHNGSTSFGKTPDTVSTVDETSTDWLTMSWMIANSSFSIYRQGVLLKNTASYSWSRPTNPLLLLGRRENFAGNNTLIGAIKELVVYDETLDAVDRATIENYVAK